VGRDSRCSAAEIRVGERYDRSCIDEWSRWPLDALPDDVAPNVAPVIADYQIRYSDRT
jgi:hypothetical protein